MIYVAHILACLFFLWSELFDCVLTSCTDADGERCAPFDGTSANCTALPGCTFRTEMDNAWAMDSNEDDDGQLYTKNMPCDDDEEDCTGIITLPPLDLTDMDCVSTSWRHGYSMAGISVNAMRPASQWLQSMYWAITTMSTIGYGDRGPANESEIMFTIAAELVGLAFFALLLDNIVSLNNVLGHKEQSVKDLKNNLVEKMQVNNLSDELILKVVKFLNFKDSSKSGHAFDENDDDFNQLSYALRKELLREVHLPLIRDVSIFGHSPKEAEEMGEVEKIFNKANDGLDGDDVGLDRNEISELVRSLGVTLDKVKLDAAMKSMDASGDGEVELAEFQNWWYTQQSGRPRMMPCPDDLLNYMAEHFRAVPSSPGDVIVERKRYGEAFFVLQSGTVTKHSHSGRGRTLPFWLLASQQSLPPPAHASDCRC